MKYKIEQENGETTIFDNKGNGIHWEDSDGNKWEAEKPKPKKDKIFIAKDLDDCLKKLKENLK